MKTILRPEKWVLELYPENSDENYKLSKFILTASHDDKIIILHTITWGIYVMTKDEYGEILTNDYFKNVKVLVNDTLNENEIAEEVYKIRMVKPSLPKYDIINSFVILTTTACNARCDYCYEKNLVKLDTMSLETAENIINFIVNNRDKGRPINIQWFGGEPLLNTKVMDYISNRLHELNIGFKSSIISNAFLFNDENIKKAKDLWNLKTCQITIDGIFETYNDIKNFVYSDVDAFLTVINNMKNIMDNTDIKITVRLNIGNNNVGKIYDAVLYLKDEFREYETQGKISFYGYKLFDIIDGNESVTDDFEIEINRIKELITIGNADKCDTFSTKNNMYIRQSICDMCMAFNGTALVILPNGQFTPCEHIKDEDIFGDVINGITDKSIIEKWQTFDGCELNYCRTQNCELQPLCPRFYNCPNIVLCSDDNKKREHRLYEARKRLVNTYLYYLDELKKKKAGK